MTFMDGVRILKAGDEEMSSKSSRIVIRTRYLKNESLVKNGAQVFALNLGLVLLLFVG